MKKDFYEVLGIQKGASEEENAISPVPLIDNVPSSSSSHVRLSPQVPLSTTSAALAVLAQHPHTSAIVNSTHNNLLFIITSINLLEIEYQIAVEINFYPNHSTKR